MPKSICIKSNNKKVLSYISNELEISRTFKENNKLIELKKYELSIDDDCDIVIQGFGFIKFTTKAKVILYIKEDISVFVRKNLI